MRLCFISDPNNVHTRRWVGWFARHGHEVCLVADIPLEKPWQDIEVIDLSKRFYAPVVRFPIWAIMLRQILRQWRPDILHAHRVNSAGWVAAGSGFHPLVVTPWGSDLNNLDRQPRLSRPLASYVVRQADLITASSQNLLNQAQLLGAQAGKCHCIQWGVDFTHFYPGSSPALLQQLEITGGPVLLSPRALNSNYNIHVILSAMPDILKRFPQAILVLRDYNTNQAYKQQLLQQISQLGIDQSIRWLGLIEPWEDNADSYRLADVVISVPISDSMAISIWEAMACGVPVIVSDVPALREWIIPGENGLLAPVGDPVTLAQATIRLLEDTRMLEGFRQSGLELARKNADHETEMSKMEGLYSSLLTRHP